jgi:hypothetical protein
MFLSFTTTNFFYIAVASRMPLRRSLGVRTQTRDQRRNDATSGTSEGLRRNSVMGRQQYAEVS